MAWLSQYFITAPSPGNSEPVRLRVVKAGENEHWMRKIGETVLQTLQCESENGVLVERFGPCVCTFELIECEGTLQYRQIGFFIGFGPLLVPLPEWLSPTFRAEERAMDEQNVLYVDVRMDLPGERKFVRYHGRISIIDSE